MSYCRIDVFVYTAAQNVWMLPAIEDLALKVFSS
jgi:hypothetical protein